MYLTVGQIPGSSPRASLLFLSRVAFYFWLILCWKCSNFLFFLAPLPFTTKQRLRHPAVRGSSLLLPTSKEISEVSSRETRRFFFLQSIFFIAILKGYYLDIDTALDVILKVRDSNKEKMKEKKKQGQKVTAVFLHLQDRTGCQCWFLGTTSACQYGLITALGKYARMLMPSVLNTFTTRS